MTAFVRALSRYHLALHRTLAQDLLPREYYKLPTRWERLIREFGDKHGVDIPTRARINKRDLLAEVALMPGPTGRGMLPELLAMAQQLYGRKGGK